MSSKRKGTPRPKQPTPQPATSKSKRTPSGTARPRSPQSPRVTTRIEEKEELAHLNDRLANYIDRVRHLESENAKLERIVSTTQETTTQEVTRVRSMYEAELDLARKALDETSKDRARLQIQLNKYQKEADEANAKLSNAERGKISAEKRALNAERELQDARANLANAEIERRHFEDENKKLRKENADLSRQLDTTKKQLEEETLTRVDLQNRFQSLKEELEFRNTFYEQQLTEVKTKKQVEVSEIDSRLRHDYDSKLGEALRDLRAQFDEQSEQSRIDMYSMYEDKMGESDRRAENAERAAAEAREDAREYRIKFTTIQRDYDDLKLKVADLEKRARDSEDKLATERERFSRQIEDREQQIQELNGTLRDRLIEYQDLMDTKIKLDMEIAAYRKLLEGEESRLKLNPTPKRGTPGRGGTPIQSVVASKKRKRTVLSQSEESSQMSSAMETTSSSNSDLEVYECDPDGAFVKIYNKSDKDVSIGSWRIERNADNEQMSFKFHRNAKVPGEEFVTVWSMDANATHNAPKELVMKSQKWAVGGNMNTQLFDNHDKEMASRQNFRAHISQSVFRQRGGTSSNGEGEEVEVRNGEDQRCSIM